MDAGDDLGENVLLIEQWCYQEGLPDMVPLIYFTAGYLDIPEDIRAETLVAQDAIEDWFNDLAFEANLEEYPYPWSEEAIDQMRDMIDQTKADITDVDQTEEGVVTYLKETRDLVLAQAQALAVAAEGVHREIVVPRCQTTVTYTEPLACFHFKPHLEYSTGVFKNRSNVLFDMDRFRLRFKWCKNLSRRLFNTR